MAPEYLAPGVYVEETSLRAPGKADVAFGKGHVDEAPVEAIEGSASTGKHVLGEARPGPEATRAPELDEVTVTSFNGGHIEEDIVYEAVDRHDAERSFEPPGRDVTEMSTALDDGTGDAFDA